jgi:hypothetical protein
MTRQIPTPYPHVSTAGLEGRVRRMEIEIAQLTEMIKVLARELEATKSGMAVVR